MRTVKRQQTRRHERLAPRSHELRYVRPRGAEARLQEWTGLKLQRPFACRTRAWEGHIVERDVHESTLVLVGCVKANVRHAIPQEYVPATWHVVLALVVNCDRDVSSTRPKSQPYVLKVERNFSVLL